MSEEASSEQDYVQIAHSALSGPTPNYNLYHAAIAATHMDVLGRNGLIVGCNRGEDCKLFVDFGAESLVGLDVMDEIGINFVSDRVSYVRESAECMPFDDATFDFIFCFATMEHVPDVAAAYGEMARVLRPGAVVYCVAAPLWCSREGPHWGNYFDSFPWIHLRRNKSQILEYARKQRIIDPQTMVSDDQVEYWLDPGNINQRRARDYVNACASIESLDLVRNEIDFENPGAVDRAAVRECVALGYDAFDLFGLTHTLIARKI